MTSWKHVLNHIAADAETHMDALRYRLHEQLGGWKPIQIVPYIGYARADRLYLRGRVLEDRHIHEAEANDSLWENLLNMYKRMDSNEVPYARLRARFQDVEQEIVADEEGFFTVDLSPRQPIAPGRLWQTVDLELLHPIPEAQRGESVTAQGQAFTPPPGAAYGVISDIDDTILRSDATHLLRMARNVFIANVHTRIPFPGAAALYRALLAGMGTNGAAQNNPLFYVSSSPWNLYDLLAQFFHLQDIPIGPVLFLRDWGLTETEVLPLHSRAYKAAVIRRIMDFYPELPFVLIGDSGQEDPEIYAEIVAAYPRRIRAVYIRNVSRDLKRPEAIQELAKKIIADGSALVLADDSLAIAQHAVELGLIPAAALSAIHEDKKKDEAPPSPLETLLGDAPQQPEAAQVRMDAPAVDAVSVQDVIKQAGKDASDAPPTVVVKK